MGMGRMERAEGGRKELWRGMWAAWAVAEAEARAAAEAEAEVEKGRWRPVEGWSGAMGGGRSARAMAAAEPGLVSDASRAVKDVALAGAPLLARW